MTTSILTGKNLKLRALEPSDVEILYHWENDASTWRVSNTLVPFSRFQLEQYVMNSQHDLFREKQLRLMIDLIKPGEPAKTIGCIDLFDFDPHNRRAGIGILIISEEREMGFAGEALVLLIQYGFEILQLHQLYCNILEDNHASIRLFEKSGFTRCGVKKEWRYQDETWMDEIMFQFIRE